MALTMKELAVEQRIARTDVAIRTIIKDDANEWFLLSRTSLDEAVERLEFYSKALGNEAEAQTLDLPEPDEAAIPDRPDEKLRIR